MYDTQWNLFSCSDESGSYGSNTNPDTEISAAISVLSPQDPTEYPSAVG